MICTTDRSNPPADVSWVVNGRAVQAPSSSIADPRGGWITTSNMTVTITSHVRFIVVSNFAAFPNILLYIICINWITSSNMTVTITSHVLFIDIACFAGFPNILIYIIWITISNMTVTITSHVRFIDIAYFVAFPNIFLWFA